LSRRTLEKLQHVRPPGQSYDSFICQLLDLWQARTNHLPTGPAGGNQGARRGRTAFGLNETALPSRVLDPECNRAEWQDLLDLWEKDLKEAKGDAKNVKA
jgi:hypothetical protein